MRAFLAIELPGDVVAALLRLQAGLPVGRPVAEENLHLTLAFLGDQPEAALEALHYELEAIRAAPFRLGFSGLGAFGGDRPRVLFADLRPSAELTALHGQVMRALRRAEVAVPRERYHPHVTLARFGGGRDRGAGPAQAQRLRDFIARYGDISAPRFPDFDVTGFGLYRSTLHPQGAQYDLLAHYALI
ncbi:MAG: RNA 2',3'-cyclic phosphodiesterase [Pseudodonghicola sp.]